MCRVFEDLSVNAEKEIVVRIGEDQRGSLRLYAAGAKMGPSPPSSGHERQVLLIQVQT